MTEEPRIYRDQFGNQPHPPSDIEDYYPQDFMRIDEGLTTLEATSDEPRVEMYARVGYTYSKSGGWSHKDGTVSAKISGVLMDCTESGQAVLTSILETLSVLSEQHASQEIARRNHHGADGPTSEIVVGEADGVSGE